MKAKKHTGPMRALLVALSVVSMLMTGLFVANATQAGADPIVCPDGFQPTEDDKSCYDHPVIVTTQAPVECEVGHLTPDATACYTDVKYVGQAPVGEGETIDATVVNNAPTVTCSTGFTLNSDNSTCSGSVSVDPTVQAPIVVPGTTTYVCASGTKTGSGTGSQCVTTGTNTVPGNYVAGTAAIAGTPAVPGTPATCPAGTDDSVVQNGRCKVTGAMPVEPAAGTSCAAVQVSGTVQLTATHTKVVCYASLPLVPAVAGIPAVPGIPAVAATCNGVATTAGAAACTTTVPTSSTVAATPQTGPAGSTCAPGFMSKNNGTQCSMANADATVTQPATVTSNPPTVTCPPGYEGPSSNHHCTRTVLTAQADVPVCESGTLLNIGNGFVCLLDNKPVAPEAVQQPSCPKGEYDAKVDLCLVPATVGNHPGTVAVGPKASDSGAIAPAFTG